MQEDNNEPDQQTVTGDAEHMDLMQELEATRAKLEEAETALAQVRDSQLRERAEIENQRRRVARELDQARRFANERLLRELLPVCDN
ncbi:MAG: nucleotide exchange factor GrpE, partial [Rhodanobacteraceae bacterium]